MPRAWQISATDFSPRRCSRTASIDTQDATSRSHCLRDASRDRTCSTTDIQHCHAWVEGRREPAVIPFERASLKNLWIGSVRLAAHGAVSLDHDGRTKPTAAPADSCGVPAAPTVR